MATVATRREEKDVPNKKRQESTWLRPAFSWKAVTLKFRLLSIQFTSEAFETGRKMSCQLTTLAVRN